MSFVLILVLALCTLAAIYFSIQPFLASRESQVRLELIDDEVRSVELLVARKEGLLRGLRELEFDKATEKLSPEDYERFRLKLERQAIGVMRELDAIHGGRQWKNEVDQFIADRLPEIEAKYAIEATRGSKPCPDCTTPYFPDDRFCSKCGAKLDVEVLSPMGHEVPG